MGWWEPAIRDPKRMYADFKTVEKIAKVTEKFDDQEAMKYGVFRFSSVYKSFWFVYFW